MIALDYVVKRLTQALVAIWGAVTLSFILVKSMPGSLATLMASQLSAIGNMSPQEINNMLRLYMNLHPDQPLWKEYLFYMRDILFHFDFGKSVQYNEAVKSVIMDALPWTIFISIFAITIGTMMFLLIGAFLATKEGTKWDVFGSYFVMFTDAIPFYIVGLVVVFALGFVAEWFPTQGRMTPGTTPGFNIPFMKGVLYHAALPILAFALTAWGGLSFRAHCVRVLGEDYIRSGRLRGLRQSRIMTRYVAWNSLLPMYTGIMASMAAIFGGSIIMERIFTYPGMGYYMWKAIQGRDYPLMMGGFIIFTVVTVTALLIADLTYGWIDPRVSNTDDAETYGTNLSLAFANGFRRLRQLFSGSAKNESIELDPIDLSGVERVNDGGTPLSNGGGTTRNTVSNGGSVASESTSPVQGKSGAEGGWISKKWDHYYRIFDRYVRAPAKILWTSPRARVGLLIVVGFFAMAYIGPLLIPQPATFQGSINLRPMENPQFPLGTSDTGVNLVNRLVYSTPPMLEMMFAGALFTGFVSSAVGIAAGYFGGTIDRILTTITDIAINIPGIPLVVVLAALFQPKEPAIVGVILAIDDWPALARQLRSEMLTIREKSYVEAARAMGLPSRTIFSKKVLMNLMPLITMNTMKAARNIIFVSAGLYFLGILPYTTLNWGVWLNTARDAGALADPSRFYLLGIPLAAIVTISFGLMLLAQGTDRLFNPRIIARHAKTTTEEETRETTETGNA